MASCIEFFSPETCRRVCVIALRERKAKMACMVFEALWHFVALGVRPVYLGAV